MNDAFLAQVYNDIKDGVEHLPGFAFGSGINWQEWLKSEMYWLISLDRELLGRDALSARSLECRHQIALEGARDEATVCAAVDRCLSD